MSYREKVAWLSLLAMLLVFIPYFTWASLNPPGAEIPNFRQMGIYAVASLSWAAILGIGHLLLRWKSSDEAKLPLDERDIAIAHKSRGYAYGVLIAGMILVGGIMPFTNGGWEIVNTMVFMIVLAECISDANIIRNYRRQNG
ncbi:MAG TPA: hypothetical protein VN247_01595 [Arenimonas sp.]|nr:hypothetical protein [Arenimonas sp.]